LGISDIDGHAAFRRTVDARAGRYTLGLISAGSVSGNGFGYGMLTVNKRGKAVLAGVLPGGVRFGGAAAIDSAGTVPFYRHHVRLGTQVGRLTFRDVQGESDADGIVCLRDSSGAEEFMVIRAARFIGVAPQPSAGTPACTIRMVRPDSSEWIADGIGRVSLVARAPSGELMTLRISARTGLFSGRYTTPARSGFSLAGALYQKGSILGFGRLNGAVGSVQFLPIRP
jgi:hypothetical protein